MCSTQLPNILSFELSVVAWVGGNNPSDRTCAVQHDYKDCAEIGVENKSHFQPNIPGPTIHNFGNLFDVWMYTWENEA